MEYNILEEMFRKLYAKYRIYYSRKEMKLSLIIAVFAYYMVQHQKKYDIELNPMLDRETVSAFISVGKVDYIEGEILIPVERTLKLNEYISNVFRNLKTKKDLAFMSDLFGYVLRYEDINVMELIDFIHQETELNEVKENETVNQLIKKMIEIKEDACVLDHFAGIGETLFTVVKDKNIRLQLQDMDEQQCAIATILLVMQGYTNFTVINANTLTYADEKKFDFVISVPPLIMDTTQMSRENYFYQMPEPSKRDSWGSVMTSFNKMKENGQAILLVNTGALTSSKRADILMREYLVKNGYIKTIIELPEKMLYGTNVKTALLMIDRKGNSQINLVNLDSPEGRLCMRKSPLDGLMEITQEGIETICKALQDKQNKDIFKMVSKNDLLENFELLPSLYMVQEAQYQCKNLRHLLDEREMLQRNIKKAEEEYTNILIELQRGNIDGKY